MRSLLFLLGVLALIGAGVLAVLPITGEDRVSVGGVSIGSPLELEFDCGSVAAPVQAREGTGFIGDVAEKAFAAGTTCDELLNERAGQVGALAFGGVAAVGLAFAGTILVWIGRLGRKIAS